MKGFCDKPQFAYMYINLGSNNLYKLLFIYLWKKLNKKTSVTNTIAQSTCIQRLIPNLTTKAKQHIYPYLRDYYGLQLFNNVGT